MDDTIKFASYIDALLARPELNALVSAYFDPANRFAATDFDTLGENLRGRIAIDDLLAATLLDIRFPPDAVRKLLHTRADAITDVLTGWEDVPLWEATDHDLSRAEMLWDLLRCRNVNRAKQSKLCARKRPKMIPVHDGVVHRFFGYPNRFWYPLRAALSEGNRHKRIDALRPPGLPGTISALRLLDVAVWMTESRSQYVVRLRRIFEGE